MAAAANHSPRNSGSSGGGADASSAALNSPHSKRGAAARGVSSPWSQVVRGADSESIVSSSAPPASAAPPPAVSPSSSSASATSQGLINNTSPESSPSKAAAAAFSSSSSSLSSPDDHAVEAQSESTDCGTGSSNAVKKPAWNKPSNGVVEVGPVMGAVSWPALSESTRASPKLSSSDSFKALPDAPVSVSQGIGIATSSTPKQVLTNNTNPSLTPNHVTPTRQKSMKRGGGSSSGNVTANGGFSQPPPLGSVVEMPSNNSGKSGSAVPESSPRDQSGQRGGFGSQPNSGNDHPQQRNSFRRGNGGNHPRGDGSYHHNYGGRRDQDRGNHEWNSHRSFNGRDPHMQPQRGVSRGFIRSAPHSPTPFIPPPPMPGRPFGNHMVYPEVPSPMIYVPTPPPIVAAMSSHAMFFPPLHAPDPQLPSKIVTQIEYYFSNENLIKDTFLRQNMDDQGWVPINLIAGFKKVMILTDNTQFILDAVRASSLVEVKDDKVRRRNDWFRWIMPSSVQFAPVSSPQSIGRSSHDTLAANIQSMSFEEMTNRQGQSEAFLSRSSSGDLNIQPQAGSEHAILARTSSK
ncbi:hypothetical protein ACSBR2_009517 [Camellia fascicularis]